MCGLSDVYIRCIRFTVQLKLNKLLVVSLIFPLNSIKLRFLLRIEFIEDAICLTASSLFGVDKALT